jgi:hypothetical protein
MKTRAMNHMGSFSVQVLLRRIYRERRRLLIFAVLTMISSYLWFDDFGQTWLGLPKSVWLALIIGLGLTLPATLLALYAPRWRHMVETSGIALFFYTIVMMQLSPALMPGAQTGIAPFVFFLFTAVIVQVLIYGTWSDRLLLRRRQSERGVGHTKIRKSEAWALVMPSPDQEVYWDETVTSVNRIEGKPGQPGDVLLIAHLFPNGHTMAQQVRLKEVNTERSLRYAYAVPAAKDGSERDQSCAILFEERGSDLTIHARWDRVDYPWRRTIMHWIDDWAGRSLDTIIQRCEVVALAKRAEAAKVAPLVRPKDRRSDA